MISREYMDVPSDQALESLLAQTRSELTEQVNDEAERVNRDLDDLVHRVKGSQRGARAAVLRARAQTLVDEQRALQVRKESQEAHTHRGQAGQPGASAGARVELSRIDLESLGVPQTLLAMRIGDVEALMSYVPAPLVPRSLPGKIVAVVGRPGSGPQCLATAERLARRTPGHSSVIVAGTRSVVPGNMVRVKSIEDLDEELETRRDTTTYLVLTQAETQVQKRLLEALARHDGIEEVWAVVDCDDSFEDVQRWMLNLPGGLKASTIAAFNVWECSTPAQVLSLSTPVSLLDLAPATAGQWSLVFQHCLH